jgi:uncharacterized metal-binding protein
MRITAVELSFLFGLKIFFLAGCVMNCKQKVFHTEQETPDTYIFLFYVRTYV